MKAIIDKYDWYEMILWERSVWFWVTLLAWLLTWKSIHPVYIYG